MFENFIKIDEISSIFEVISGLIILLLSINKFHTNNIISKYSKGIGSIKRFELFFLIREIILVVILGVLSAVILSLLKINNLIGIIIINHEGLILNLMNSGILIFCGIIQDSFTNIINRYIYKLHGIKEKVDSEYTLIVIFKKFLFIILGVLSFIYSEKFFLINEFEQKISYNTLKYFSLVIITIIILICIKDFDSIEKEINESVLYIVTLDDNRTYTCNTLLELKTDYLVIQDGAEIYINKNFVKTISKIKK